MPYKRKYKYKRKRFRKRMSLAKKAYYMAKGLKRNQELKFQEQSLNILDTNSIGNIYDVFNPAEGLTDQTRIGDKVIVKSLSIRLSLQQTTDDDVLFRMIMFYDKTNVIDDIEDVLLSLPVSNPGPQPLRQYNKDKRSLFTVLLDKTITLSNASRTIAFRKYYKRMSKWVQFNAGTQNIARGQMKLLLISNIDDVSPNLPVFLSTIRWKYIDS